MAPDEPTPADDDFEATRVIGQVTAAEATETLPKGSQDHAAAPRQVGRYEISERIGRGGMASVFRAYDPSIDRVIAIKFLHAAYCEDEEYRNRFLREARAAGMLSHPNIVIVHDVGEIERRPYIAMELVDGEALNDTLARGPASIRETLVTGLQLARALDYAHGKGIVHRDIKPSNIMRLSGSQTIKVMDFGIAHLSTKSDLQQTRVGDVLGTPQYMSPEQTRGGKIDGRSDLFSTGIILYQMLAGHAPFQADSVVALVMKIANEEPEPIEKLRPDVPQSVRRIVERCLAKQADRRFQSGAELADAIGRAMRDIEDEARQREQPRLVPLRLKWALMMGAIVFAVMAATGAVVNRRQSAALTDQVTDYGASLSRFIAAQSAASALGEEWEAVEVSLQETMKTGDFASITVMDAGGVVRAASESTLVGKPHAPRSGESLGTRSGGVKVSRYAAGGEPVLSFESPITFQGKLVGRVDLGITERPLVAVARLSLVLMAVLVVVTVLAVAVASYFLANWFAQPIKLLRDSLVEIEHGRFEHRIRDDRKDEYGLLYQQFNRMSQALHEHFMPAATEALPAAEAAATATQAPAGPAPPA